MRIDPDTLPANVEALRAQVLALAETLEAERTERQRVEDLNDRLRHLIRQLQRMQFGPRSERLDADQLNLALEDVEQARAETEAVAEKDDPALKRRRTGERRKARGSLPPHLPRVEVVVAPESTACPCCQGAMHVIGEDRSERLDVVPARYQVIVTRRPRYGCRTCSGAVVQAPAPARLIEGGLPTERLVAAVLVTKYADHVPLYRQAQGFARQGIVIDRLTLAFWVGYAAAELTPIWRLMRADLLRSGKLFVDETKAPVLDPGRGRTKSGYFWALARDDRPWRGGDPPAVVYHYAPGRSAKHAAGVLDGFAGIIQTDGYIVYKTVANRAGIAIAHCWAHLRREFFDVTKTGPAPIAEEALRRIARLYAIEAEIRGRTAAERRSARQARSRPLVEDLKRWLERQLGRVSAKSTTAEAIRYALNQWTGLVRFLDDGRIEIDSNTVERSIRPLVLNRKNALFAGHDRGAENWAVIASLIETCKLQGVNPEAYLADVLTRLVDGWSNARLAELTPWAWAEAQATAVRAAA
ncbi:IS66 family transposase [Nitrospirillum viridazoti]|uniref:IS66 family transposase n=1 Tax=Nitrospirillum viridazoti CBAmc TaxID=1441467 RepID=A0A248K0S2_9PROT|nr:IS66 family transposase [Nitrospirillum amazonense]ASG24356.1 IS66 family transposase [Nitrospirillum amazonense CBAmc]TWB33308.1 transposase [Nitrospirillum amazonense]